MLDRNIAAEVLARAVRTGGDFSEKPVATIEFE